MKKFLLWLFISLLCLSNLVVFWTTSGVDLSQKIDQQNIKIETISNELSWFKGEYKNITQQYKNISDLSSNIIDKWLARQSQILAIFAFLITIIWIALSIIIDRYYMKVKDIKTNSEVIHKATEDIHIATKKIFSIMENEIGIVEKTAIVIDNSLKEVKNIQEEIEKYPDKIYQKIINEETKYIFKRLNDYPEDIHNFFSKLATREIDWGYYTDILNLFNNENVQENPDLKISYMTLIYQHFYEKIFTTEDEEIWKNFIVLWWSVFRSCFPKELEDISIALWTIVMLHSNTTYKQRYSEYIQKLNETWILSKKDNNLYKKIYNTFINQWKKDLFVEICNNVSLDPSFLENE